MRRIAVLFALAACSEAAPKQAAPPNWVYPPAATAWPLGTVTGTIGRSQAPDVVLAAGIFASPNAGALVPLRMPTPWPVPGEGPARAVIYGLVGSTHAVELIDIDKGVLAWRDTTACGAPVVGVTDESIVCADAKGVRAIGLADGKQRWKADATFIAMTDDRVITAGAGESVVLDATSGDELARVKMPGAGGPAAVLSDSILASCGDAGRELFAFGQDGQLVHIVEAQGGPKIQWSVPLATITSLDACEGEHVLVMTSSASGTSLVALARATGKVTGSIDDVRGFWPARDGSSRIEVSTVAGVTLHERSLAGARESVGLPVLGELLDKRGETRLVRATPSTAVVLDRQGVRAYLPLAQLGAVLGDDAIIAGSWQGSPGETVRRIAIPDGRYRRRLRVPRIGPGVGVTAELRDLPAMQELDAAGAIAKLDAGKNAVGSVALDPSQPAVYATALEREPDEHTSAGVARFDLSSKTWTWYRADGCGPGTPVALAVSDNVVLCAARTKNGATVHATTRDGQPAWTWLVGNLDGHQNPRAASRNSNYGSPRASNGNNRDGSSRASTSDASDGSPRTSSGDDRGASPSASASGDGDRRSSTTMSGDSVDSIDAVGGLVLVRGADRAYLLDADQGYLLGSFASDDGGALPAAVLDVDGMEMLVTAERGRVMGRLPRAQMVPAWSLDVAGVVKLIVPAGDGVLVELEDGDAYRIDARTGAVSGVAGIGLAWTSAGDTLAGGAPGGPIPPATMPSAAASSDGETGDSETGDAPKKTAKKAPKKAAKKAPKKEKPAEKPDEALGPPARLARDVWPDPGPLPASWQLALYEVSGALRARNDYALDAPITPATARGVKAPLVVQSGSGLRDVLVLEPERGDPVRRVRLPEDAAPGTAFSTVLDGKPVVGVLLANPLRVVMF